jgi:hypothetical protein
MTYSKIITSFSGISPTTDPPHNALAAGPNNLVMVEGSTIEWTDLSGGNATPQSVYNFFGPLGPTGDFALFDQRAVYDSVNGRFIVTMDNLNTTTNVSDVDIAISKDSNPNDGWFFYSLNTALTINGQLTASDQPILSVDGTNIYVTTPQYNVSGAGASFEGTQQWVISDTAGAGGGVYGGGTMTVAASPLAPPGQGIMRVVAGGNGKSYYAGAVSSGGQTVLTLQSYDVATNTFGATTTLSLGNSDQSNGGADFTAQQQGTNVVLDAGDGRIQNLAYSNGFLYGVFEVKPVGSSAPEVHWFKIDVSNPNSPTLVAQGDISGAAIGTGVATFDASIAVDAAGDAVINFTASGPNLFPSDYYVYHGAADPATTFSDPILYQGSNSFLNNGDPASGGANTQRWGINSTATADPNNPNSFWLSSEYVANGQVQTSVERVAGVLPPTSAALVQESNGALDYLEFSGTNLVASDQVSQYTSWNIAAEGDFNNDGRTDLVAQDPNSGAIDLLFLKNGALQGSLLEQGDYWKVVGAGDFDGSGRTGVATQNTTTGQVDLLWFIGTQLTASELLNGSYQNVVGAADFNGDGKTDLVTQSQGGGPLDFLFFNNAALSASALTPQSFSPVHDATNTGVSGQSVLLSQLPGSGQIDYLEFNGTLLAGTQLDSTNLAGSTVLQGTQVAAQLFSHVG